ncbi:site-specific DNA-methyltransferase [Amycolatopsis sp. NPDC049688]|uniref:DNA-methyltransferase n=1 Tax=Amycolatopsis sp. NPDC049688 TaxID=3154733 RepID=UPI003438F6A2
MIKNTRGSELQAPRQLPRNTILVGDARQQLSQLPSGSVDTIITSPPYFGVRDYGHDQQLGAEPDVDTWASTLRDVAAELARVLRPTGTLWLNLGDSYAHHLDEGATPKSLLLGPARVALALVRDGWTLRNEVVWAKSNPMPSSVGDRLTTTHELVYFFSRSRRYYFNLDEIRQPLVTPRRPPEPATSRTYPPPTTGSTSRPGRTLNDNRGLAGLKASGLAGHPLGKNPGDVWTLPTAGFRGGHFAAYPLVLAERCLLATCPERVCAACGAPWRRRLERQDGRLVAVDDLRAVCQCDAASRSGVVLDPFLGSGTTALAAEKHGRDWLGIELNPEYAAMAEERMAAARTISTSVQRKAA